MKSLAKKEPQLNLLLLEWWGIVIIGTVVFTAIALTLESAIGSDKSATSTASSSDFLEITQLAPLGWITMGLVGPLWMILAGLVVTIKTKKRRWHVLTVLGTIVFGLKWPATFWMWMSA